MNTINISQIKAWEPDAVEYLPADWAGTALDLLKTKVPARHKLNLVSRIECIDAKILVDFCEWCAATSQHTQPWDNKYLEKARKDPRYAYIVADCVATATAWAADAVGKEGLTISDWAASGKGNEVAYVRENVRKAQVQHLIEMLEN